MNKLIKEKIKKLKPSATIALNEKSKKLILLKVEFVDLLE